MMPLLDLQHHTSACAISSIRTQDIPAEYRLGDEQVNVLAQTVDLNNKKGRAKGLSNAITWRWPPPLVQLLFFVCWSYLCRGSRTTVLLVSWLVAGGKEEGDAKVEGLQSVEARYSTDFQHNQRQKNPHQRRKRSYWWGVAQWYLLFILGNVCPATR